MIKVATASQMMEIDRWTIKSAGMPGVVLMERAAMAVVQEVREEFAGMGKALVVCGPGNNGADGLAVARELHNAGYRVKALVAAGRDKIGKDCAHQLKVARGFGVEVAFGYKVTSADIHGAFIVDAIFGTGLSKPIRGAVASLVETINASGCPVASVDIPSGICSDTGQVLGVAVDADITVSFGLPKRGHFLYPGAERCGDLSVHDIGFPAELLDAPSCSIADDEDMAALLPERPANAHKSDFGHVLVIAGSRGKSGAAFLASGACLAAGAGLVTMGAPENLSDVYMTNALEEMTLPLPALPGGAFSSRASAPALSFVESRADVIAIGPGIGRDPDTAKMVRDILVGSTAPVVVDADALHAVGAGLGIFDQMRAPAILTPHPGEFARLVGKKVREVEADRIESALCLSRTTGAYVVLKGTPTIIASPEGECFINPTGGPELAKAGSGDVLTGIIAGLLAQGLSPLHSALLGTYAHGMSAELAAADGSHRSVLASDVINYLPSAFSELEAEG